VAESAAIKYQAFLSYSHRDQAWARWLHARLESYRIDKDLIGRATATGSVPPTLRPIFCDRDDFSAGYSLDEQTMAALAASRFLVAICSPHAVKSKYVDEEIRHFKALGYSDRIIPIIIDGEPNDPDRECFPAALRFKVGADGELTNVPEEPIAADARRQGEGRELAKLKVVAGLLGLPLDEVVHRAERARRRRNRIATGIAAGFVLLLLGLTGSIIDSRHKQDVSDNRLAQLLDSADKTIQTATKNMDRVGFSIASSLPFLQSQEENLKKEIERGVDTPKLHFVWAQMLVLFADTYLKLAETEKSLSRAKQASAELENLIAGQFGAADWQQNVSNIYRKIWERVTRPVETQPQNFEWQNSLSVAYRKVGDGLSSLDRWSVALEWYRRSLQLAQGLEKTDATKVEWQTGLSTAYAKVGDASKGLGNLGEARANYAASIAIRERLVAADPDNLALQRDLASVYDRLSDVLAAQSQLREAFDIEQKSVAIALRLVDEDKNNSDWRRDLALTYRKTGDLQRAMRKFTDAIDQYREGFRILEKLTGWDSNHAVWQHDLAALHLAFGALLSDQEEADGAEEHVNAAIAILKRLADVDPQNTQRQQDLALAYDNLGIVLGRQAASLSKSSDMGLLAGRTASANGGEELFAQAIENYSSSLAIRENLAAKDPENVQWQYNLGAAHGNLATIFMARSDLDNAGKEFATANEIFKKALQMDAANPLIQHDLALGLAMMGELLMSQNKIPDALASYRESLHMAHAITADNDSWRHDLARLHHIMAAAHRALDNRIDALLELRNARDIMAGLTERVPQWASELRQLKAEIANLEANSRQ